MTARLTGSYIFLTIFLVKTYASLTEILTIYDAGSVRRGLAGSNFDITDRCALDMDTLLQALDEKRLWALKGKKIIQYLYIYENQVRNKKSFPACVE